MRRLLPLLFLTLAFAGCCKRGKHSDNPPSFNESDLVGAWVCTEWVSGSNAPLSNPDISFEVNTDHTSVFHPGGADAYPLTWAINGGKLELSGYANLQECTLKKLDKKHFVWALKYDNGDQAQASFTNLLQILPGRWKSVSASLGEFDITIDASGTSTWVKGEAYPENIKWSLVFGNKKARPFIKWEGVNVDFADSFDIGDVTDDRILMTSAMPDQVTFTRQ